MAREKRIFLDCSQLARGARHGSKFIHRLRYYFGSRFRGTFCTVMSDEELFAFALAKHGDRNVNDEAVRARASADYVSWVNGSPVPDYLCSWYRSALRDRHHSPTRRELPLRELADA